MLSLFPQFLPECGYLQLLVEPGKGVVLSLVGGPPPVVQDQPVFASRVGEGHPLPRPDLSHPKLRFHLLVPEMINHTISFLIDSYSYGFWGDQLAQVLGECLRHHKHSLYQADFC